MRMVFGDESWSFSRDGTTRVFANCVHQAAADEKPSVSTVDLPSPALVSQNMSTKKIAKMDDELFKTLMEPRTQEESNFWMKVGMGVLLLGAVGSVGTFARITRVAHGSGIKGTALMKLNSQIGLTPRVAMERAAEAAVLTDRVQVLRARLKERHPLWYPADFDKK
jgi:hypothetical protein